MRPSDPISQVANRKQRVHDFYGTVSLLNEPDSALDAKVTVDLNRVVIQADDSEIGSWRHGDVEVKKVDDRIHLVADGEVLLLELDGQDFLLDLLGVEEAAPKKTRRRRREKDYDKERRAPLNLADVKTRAREAAADQLDKRLAVAMGVAAVVVLAGAALTWGPFRLMGSGDFPIGRLLAGFGGLAGLLALYLGYFDRNRFVGSAAAVAAGLVTFSIMYLYAREARLGIGFVLALLGSQALMTVGVLGILGRRAATQPEEEA